jgi:hypothetical protein
MAGITSEMIAAAVDELVACGSWETSASEMPLRCDGDCQKPVIIY